MKNSIINFGDIKKIANALGELNEDVVYVGGAVVALYMSDLAAEEVRPTQDVDISVSIASIDELEKLRASLHKKGFIQTSEDNVICRFRYHDIKVDVMNTKALGWAPANPWFASGFQNRLQIEIEGQHIFIMSLPYFLASKFSAYNSRGKDEPITSHDFEDITYILDNCTELVDQIVRANDDVKPFLKIEFKSILSNHVKQEAIAGNLFYLNRDERFAMILEKLHKIISLL